MATDGSCSVQYTLPWVVFGGGWESRLKAGNPPSPSSGAVQFRFTLVPAVSAATGSQNHLPAYFTDNRTNQTQLGESATYTLSAGQSVDIHFLYPPAGPGTLSYGSVVVQYSSFDPGTLRRQANPQLAFLARPSGEAYSSQITEQAAVAANTWMAPVAMSADPNANPQTYQQASAAINNPGSTAGDRERHPARSKRQCRDLQRFPDPRLRCHRHCVLLGSQSAVWGIRKCRVPRRTGL